MTNTNQKNMWNVAVLPGDGIGPEVMAPALDVLHRVSEMRDWTVDCQSGLIGGAAIDRLGRALPQETLEMCLGCDAVLLGSVGGPKWDGLPPRERPEIAGLLALRKELGLYANLRPVRVFPSLSARSPLREERLGEQGLDLLTVRELSGDVYYGEPKGLSSDEGYDTMRYDRDTVERIAHVAFKMARSRKRRVMSVDKANVLNSSILWRRVVSEVGQSYPDISLEHMYVDNAAMQLTLNPSQFDLILTGNLFGDILSDASAALAGSLGLLPSASLGTKGIHLYEPAGGSAPDLAGRDLANPLAQILSVAMMVEHSFLDSIAARAIERAVERVISDGVLTADLVPVSRAVGTRELGAYVLKKLVL